MAISSDALTVCGKPGEKVAFRYSQAGAPGGIAGSSLGDFDLDTSSGQLYVCTNASGCAVSGWSAVGGSSSSINIFREETGSISISGDTDVYSVSVPALAAGKSVTIRFGIETGATVTPKIKFGSDTFNSAGAVAAAGIWKFQFELGNVAADSSHQRIVTTLGMVYSNDCTLYQAFTYAVQTFTQDWSSAVTLKIVVNGGSGSVVGRYLSVKG